MNIDTEDEIVIKSLITRIKVLENEIFELNKVREQHNKLKKELNKCYGKTENSQLNLLDLYYTSKLENELNKLK